MSGKKAHRCVNTVLWIMLFVLSFGIVISILMFFSDNHGGYEVYRLEDGWNVKYCGRYFNDASRSDRRFDKIKVKRNDIISMHRKITIDDVGRRLTLRIYSRKSSVRVSIVDNRGVDYVIYYYGYSSDGLHNGDFLGTGYHFIQLPQNCQGKTLRIMEMASQDDAFKGIPEIVVTDSDHAMEYFAQERSVGTFITIFMLILGSAVSVLSIFMVRLDRKFYNITLIGLFSALSGLWCMCSMKAIELFSLDIRTNSIIEYICLYLMTIPLMWLAMRFMNKARGFVHTIFFESMLINIVMVVVAIVMQYIGYANIDTLLVVFHVLIGFDAVSLTTVSIVRWRKAELPERFFETGIFFAAGLSIVYLIYFYFKTSNTASDSFEVIVMPIALLFMVTMMMLGYVSDLYIRKVDDVQKAQLVSLAYNDELTGLYNRTVGENKMRELDASENRYLIINMDLNFLKKVNDIAGHAAGDKYIRTFASILKEIFADSDIICRMGGDEFLITYSNALPDEESLNERFRMMEDLEKERSDFMPDGIEIDASYGYAYSDGIKEHDSAYVYSTADARMYQMKTLSKKGRVD